MPNTDVLLKAKWESQRKIAEKAKEKGMSYFDYVNKSFEESLKARGRKLKFAKLPKSQVNLDLLRAVK